MLPDRLCQLLSAYVDGELTARQRRRVARVLDRSPEARAFLEQLERDAQRLRNLPRLQAPQDFAESVLAALGERPIVILPPRAVRGGPGRVPFWVGAAAAAVVLLAVGTASFLFFSTEDSEPGRAVVAVAGGPAVREKPPAERGPMPSVRPPTAVAKEPEPELVAPPTAVAADKSDRRPEVEPPAAPAAEGEAVLASPSPKMEMFKEIADPRLALVFKLRELDQDRLRQRLLEELQKDAAYRVEVGCLASSRAFDRLQTQFKSHGIRLLIDQDAQERLKRRLLTNYVLYTENVTPEELTKVLQQLGLEDKQAEAKKRGDGQFERVVVNRLLPADHKELAKLLGVDLTQPAAKPKLPQGVDIRKSLADKTAEQVVQGLKGQGPPRPEPGRAAAPERLAIVLAYNPVRPRPASKEVKQFLDARREPRAGTLQMLLVLRGTGG
jgi:anti-sigma factor RsiW